MSCFRASSPSKSDIVEDLEVEVDLETQQKVIKTAPPRLLIAELFSMSLKYMNQFFDTYPLYVEPTELLKTLIRIYFNEEAVHPAEFSGNAQGATSFDSFSHSQETFSMSSSGKEAKIFSTSFDSLSSLSQSNSTLSSMPEDRPQMSRPKKKWMKLVMRTSSNRFFKKRENLERIDTFQSNGSAICELEPVTQSARVLPNTLRVLKIISHWVTKYSIDFKNEALKKTLLEFVSRVKEEERKNEKKSILLTRANMVLNAVEQNERQLRMESCGDEELNAILFKNQCSEPSDFDPLQFEPVDLALGFTKISSILVRAINIRDILYFSQSKKKKLENETSFLKITNNFNKTTHLISTHILSFEQRSKRVRAIELWLDVAEELWNLNNYNVLCMIVGALESNAIYRLTATWSKISKKARQSREMFTKLLNPSSNYSALRAHYTKDNFIPFMGPLFTQLCYVEERNKLDPCGGRVNFKKMRMLSKLISPIRTAMTYRFNSPLCKSSQKIVMGFYKQDYIAADTLLATSMALEPGDTNHIKS